MKKVILALAFTVGLALPALTLAPATFAITVTYNNLIDDVVFDNVNTATAAQIDTFLNSFPSSCISSNNGFRAIDPTGYNPSQGFLYGGNVTAGKVIYDAAQAYSLNPEVILATLQKEQSLVTGSGGCTKLAYTSALGYGCPDGGTLHNYTGVNLYTLNGVTATSVNGTCVGSKLQAGFTQQIIHAAWQLKFDRMRAEGKVSWYIIKPNWNNSDDLSMTYAGYMTEGTYQRCSTCAATHYDGYATIDGTSIHIDNGATASLYDYTPHKSGNSSFVTIFTTWFGSVRAPSYLASFAGQSHWPVLKPGDSADVYIRYANAGASTWYDDTSLSTAPFGTKPVHLATGNPLGCVSVFSATWPSGSRPANTFGAVYESDGVTLAANQHVALSEQIVEFRFKLTVPANQASSNYQEYFRPIIEGTTDGTFKDPKTWLMVIVPKPYAASLAGQAHYPTLLQNSTGSIYFRFKNEGYQTWYDDTSLSTAPAGTKPIHLATALPTNRKSVFSATWPSGSRPANTFGAVYESDGVTLAANQHVAQQGQIVQFNVQLTVPQTLAKGAYKEGFQPVIDSANPVALGGSPWLNIGVTSASYVAGFAGQAHYPSIAQGNSASVFMKFKNIGTGTWYDDTVANRASGLKPIHLASTNPINRLSVFGSSFTAGRYRPTGVFAAVYESDGVTLAANQHVVLPGQIARFDFILSVPAALPIGIYREDFQSILEGGSPWNMSGSAYLKVTVTK